MARATKFGTGAPQQAIEQKTGYYTDILSPTLPTAASGTITSAQTAAIGSNWGTFGSAVCDQLDIVNNTGTTIEYRRGGAGSTMQIRDGSSRLVIGITNAQGGSVGMTVMSQTGVLTTLAVGAIPITYERGAGANLNANADAITPANYNKSDALDTLALDGLTFNGFATSVQTAGATNTNHGISNDKGGGFTVVSGNSYCVSVLIPAGQAQRYAQLMYFGAFFGTNAWANFDLQAGTVGSVGSAATAGVIPVPGGYRIWMSAPATGSGSTAASALNIVTTGAAARNQAYAGTGQALRFTAYQVNPGVAPTAILRTFATAPLYTAGTPRSQNLMDQSDLSAWTMSSASFSGGKLIASAGSGQHYAYRQLTSAAGIVTGCAYTVAIRAKFVDYQYALIYCDHGASAWFDLQAGTKGSTSGANLLGSSMVANADGSYECYLHFKTNNAVPVFEVHTATVDGSFTHTAAGGQGTVISGARVYEGTALLPAVTTSGTAYSEYPQAGLLLDSVGSTNVLTKSEAFDHANWSKANATVTADATVAPDGQSTADFIKPDATNNPHYVGQSYTFAAVSHGCSFYAKYGGYAWLRVGLPGGPVASVNIQTGYCSQVTSATCDVEPVGGGWFRIKLVGTTSASASSVFITVNNADSLTSLTYTGDGTSGVYLWGAQLEVGAVVTPYMKTDAASVTRAATAIRPPLTWVTDGPQTVAMTFVPQDVSNSPVVLGRIGSGQAAVMYLTGTRAAGIYDGTNSTTTGNVAVLGVPHTTAARWAGSAMAICLDGGTIATTTFDGSMGSTTVGLGDYGNGGQGFRGLVKTFKSAPTAMNDTNFQLAAAGG